MTKIAPIRSVEVGQVWRAPSGVEQTIVSVRSDEIVYCPKEGMSSFMYTLSPDEFYKKMVFVGWG